MLAHIGITINHKEDIQKFYKELLDMELIADFSISREISKHIFAIESENPIAFLQKDDLGLELFYSKKEVKPVYNHIGITVEDRQQFIKRVQEKDYPVKIFERDNKHDLIFIEDRSGNKFEVGEK